MPIGVHAAINTYTYFVISPVEQAISEPTAAQVALIGNAVLGFHALGMLLITAVLFGRRGFDWRHLLRPRADVDASPANDSSARV